jgi:hypothetical protein
MSTRDTQRLQDYDTISRNTDEEEKLPVNLGVGIRWLESEKLVNIRKAIASYAMMICSKFVLLFLVAIRYKFYSVSPEEV